MDVSYETACVNPTSESGLSEPTTAIKFAGALVEVGSTDIPTTLVIRQNGTTNDYTVSISASTILGQNKNQTTSLSDWIPGDQIMVSGQKNDNTGAIDASMAADLTINLRINKGINGWITSIDKTAQTITYQWANKDYTFKYDSNTRFVSGLKNPATADDLQINDRIRGRLVTDASGNQTAKIVVVLRRGQDLFMKIRTFQPNATLVRLDSTVIPTTIQVKIEATPGLKANDVNNLIGAAGALVTVNITEDTNIVRKYFGKATLEDLSIGDSLKIIGRVNDDGTVDAKVVKDNSIWKTVAKGIGGTVSSIDVSAGTLMLDWTPIKYLNQRQLQKTLQNATSTVTAQSVNMQNLGAALKNKLGNLKNLVNEKVGKFVRQVVQKVVKIERIQHPNVNLGDLIKRLPAKQIKVVVNSNTKISVGANTNATLSDIKTGDKVRVRGVMDAKQQTITADAIAVVSALPAIDEPLNTSLDDINQVVTQLTTDDSENSIAEGTTSSTEEVVISDNSNANSEATTTEENTITNYNSNSGNDQATSTEENANNAGSDQ